MRMISGPEGRAGRGSVDGRPVLLLSSPDALGLAEHVHVREAAAGAAMRWGASAPWPTPAHTGLEAGLAALHGTEAARVTASHDQAARRAIAALAGEVVYADALVGPALADGCRLAGARTVPYEHADPEHLAWRLRQSGGDGALIVTDAVFETSGDIAPLEDIAAVARAAGARVLVDETYGTGTLGPGGAGAAAEAGVEVDAVVGSLGVALGAEGGYVAAGEGIVAALAGCTPPAPPAAAAARAALELLIEQPARVGKLAGNTRLLRDELAREGFDVAGSCTHVIALIVGEAADAQAMSAVALDQGVHAEALLPPEVPAGTARLRLCVMASHTRGELIEAAHVLGRAALQAGLRPGTMVTLAEAQTGGEVVPLIARAA